MTDGVAYNWPLLENEHVIWSGRPAQGLLLTRRDIAMIPFSLVWGGFAAFAAWSTVSATALFLLPLQIAFCLVGLHLIVGRFFLDAWLRRTTHYGLTTQRVLIARSGLYNSFTAIGLGHVPHVQLIKSANGRGTIIFRQQPNSIWRNEQPAMSPALDKTAQFLAIDNAQHVFDLVQCQISRPPMPPAPSPA